MALLNSRGKIGNLTLCHSANANANMTGIIATRRPRFRTVDKHGNNYNYHAARAANKIVQDLNRELYLQEKLARLKLAK